MALAVNGFTRGRRRYRLNTHQNRLSCRPAADTVGLRLLRQEAVRQPLVVAGRLGVSASPAISASLVWPSLSALCQQPE